MPTKDFYQLQTKIREFAEDRDWDQFYSPKNLAMALGAEAGEILDQFRWLTQAESSNPSPEKRQEIADEIADVLILLIRLAEKLEIDPIEAAFQKIEKNEERYPADAVRGSSKKYSEYDR